MTHQRLKKFWIDKINGLITTYNIQPDETDWRDKVNQIKKWEEFSVYGTRICQNIYAKANQTVLGDVTAGDNYGNLLAHVFNDLEKEHYGFVNRIGVQPGNNVILGAIPAGKDLIDLLYVWGLYEEICGELPDLFLRNQTDTDRADKFGFKWPYKVNNTAIQNYKTAKTDRDNYENQIRTAYGLNATATIPNGWETEVNAVAQYFINDLSLTDPDNLPTMPTGKNLNDLINFYNNPPTPTCSHTDYDTLKQEHDQLKTEQATQDQAKQQAIQAKETEIITKIITDLSLSTERERENLLEAVITEIKTKITPPTDTTAKDNKITELEAKIATLQSPKSLTDLPISQEVKNEVIKISQELGLTAQSCAKLENATSYQELSTLQKEAFQAKLNSEIDSRKNANYLNWGLGALSIGSLLILAWILIKKTTFTPEIGGKKAKE